MSNSGPETRRIIKQLTGRQVAPWLLPPLLPPHQEGLPDPHRAVEPRDQLLHQDGGVPLLAGQFPGHVGLRLAPGGGDLLRGEGRVLHRLPCQVYQSVSRSELKIMTSHIEPFMSQEAGLSAFDK